MKRPRQGRTPTPTNPRPRRLEEIIARLDSGEAELRETLALCGEAKELIVFCRDELAEVSGALTELGLDELVQGLESREA